MEGPDQVTKSKHDMNYTAMKATIFQIYDVKFRRTYIYLEQLRYKKKKMKYKLYRFRPRTDIFFIKIAYVLYDKNERENV